MGDHAQSSFIDLAMLCLTIRKVYESYKSQAPMVCLSSMPKLSVSLPCHLSLENAGKANRFGHWDTFFTSIMRFRPTPSTTGTGEPTARTDIYAVVPTIRWEALSHERERFTASTRKIGEGARTGPGRENPSFLFPPPPAWSPRPPTGGVSTLRYETRGFGSGGKYDS
jgi:hypothetical protein